MKVIFILCHVHDSKFLIKQVIPFYKTSYIMQTFVDFVQLSKSIYDCLMVAYRFVKLLGFISLTYILKT